MTMERRITLLLCGILLFGSSLFHLRAETKNVNVNAARIDVDFNRDIRPILSKGCFKCHGPDLKKAGLDLQNRETAFKRLKSGNFAIVPGKSAESALIERVSSTDEDLRMPPKDKGERL